MLYHWESPWAAAVLASLAVVCTSPLGGTFATSHAEDGLPSQL